MGLQNISNTKTEDNNSVKAYATELEARKAETNERYEAAMKLQKYFSNAEYNAQRELRAAEARYMSSQNQSGSIYSDYQEALANHRNSLSALHGSTTDVGIIRDRLQGEIRYTHKIKLIASRA